MTLYLPTSFQSPTNPDHTILYTHLNKNAPNTVLLCYGAGGDSRVLTRYQTFLTTHAPFLSLICIDRWTHGPTASKTGLGLLSELTSITLELLTSLPISKFSVAAHSAGAYQMLDLVTRCHNDPSEKIQIQHVFPICTHIPAPFTGSKVMSSMCTMPTIMFSWITKLESSLADTAAEKLFLKFIGSSKTPRWEENDKFVDNARLREVLDSHKLSPGEILMEKQRASLDYRLGYARIPGMGIDALTNLYTGCPGRFTWFTCDADIFFGPKSVERIVGKMKGVEKEVEIVVVNEASHADIWLRTEVWKGIYERILRGDD